MRRHLPSGRTRRRADGDRGVAIVEMALVAPLLALVLCGIIEFGFAWRDDLTVASSARAGARVVSNLGDADYTDYETILSVQAGLGGLNGATVTGVMVFDASLNGGEPSTQCFDAGGNPQSSAAGNCNYYSEAMIASMAATDFSTGVACGAGAWDRYYCPLTERSTNQAVLLSDVGVWIEVERPWLTGMFPGDGLTMHDIAVMRLEPATS